MGSRYNVYFVEEDFYTTIEAANDKVAINIVKALVQRGDRGDSAVYVHVRIQRASFNDSDLLAIVWDGDMVCEAAIDICDDDDSDSDFDWENEENRFRFF